MSATTHATMKPATTGAGAGRAAPSRADDDDGETRGPSASARVVASVVSGGHRYERVPFFHLLGDPRGGPFHARGRSEAHDRVRVGRVRAADAPPRRRVLPGRKRVVSSATANRPRRRSIEKRTPRSVLRGRETSTEGRATEPGVSVSGGMTRGREPAERRARRAPREPHRAAPCARKVLFRTFLLDTFVDVNSAIRYNASIVRAYRLSHSVREPARRERVREGPFCL